LALAYVAAAALPIGLIFLVRAVNPARMPLFSPSPWVLESTCAAAATAVLCSVSLGLRRRVRFWGFWSANAVWTALFALLLAVKLPGASYLAWLPAVAGLAPMVLRMRRGPAGSLPEWATVAYVFVSFGLFWPILIFLYDGLGRPGLPLLVVLPVFAAAPLVGLLLMTGRSVQRAATGVAVLGLLVGAAAAVTMPAYSVGSPQALNLHYVLELTDPNGPPRPHWLVSQLAPALAPQLSRLLPFRPARQDSLNPLLIFQRTEFRADAPPVELVAPTLSVLSVVRVPEAGVQLRRARYELRIAPNASVSELQMAFAPQAAVRSVRIGTLDFSLAAWDNGWTVLSLINPPEAGLSLSFEAAEGPFDISMANVSYGLPAAAADLLQALPADTIAHEGGNDTRMLTTVHMPKLIPPRE
jgi:hypothetical protein